ncbi:molybdopterin biosynthesis protein [Halorubrum ezzemoulense]|uniref:Molybdopterin biosynthesis protein n=1 Tax=Halorubrum ezzemoulense TaxID=337243 RepID=A0ABT4Z0X0_HALEZ|nr:molybdopterin biosynthesis protein [Halorubrum ezzemoulense]MDB2244360.1 molybdopterin biosynthesis protein [Halorubrum ezzemoulense]MDB2278883.1 molybdopterin biosynthesis protein [Halorubrum ezzemoulense]MDB2287694.1 molybdopterin biosynthesis protein [Halorubrum ezzemoulense]MDB2291819.1 molybdopterin biosynthesis protein [Halorubrum ezzemoulense]MDB2295518.1 molybdopterin biosynthesis protein [Halorubrum ezzemoulense]
MSDRKEFRDLATPEAAREAIESLDLSPTPETVSLADARGRVLAERVDAAIDVPGFDRASMDGYAVRARETFGADEADPAELDLVGAVHAGAAPDVTVEPGTCAEISTGAVMPDGADAVVMVERTDELGSGGDGVDDDGHSRIAVRTSVAPGDHVMTAGTDIAAGARALGPGTRLTPREIGLLSALGVDEVPVEGRPRVGIVSTGDELVRPGEALNPDRGEIYDVNSTTIAAGVEEAGGEPVLYPHAGDDYDEMERLLRRAADECDLVLSSGSTSASAVDVIYRVIEARGELLLHGVAVKPGKPMLIGRLDRGGSDGGDGDEGVGEDAARNDASVGESAYVGLPGYPVSALTIFRTFVAPAIRDAAGQPEPATATVEGRMGVSERYSEGRLRLMPVGLLDLDDDAPPLVYPVDKGSGATTSLVEADGVVAVDPDTEVLDAGEAVEVQLFSPDVRPPTLLGVGEDDPALNRLLDRLANPRYLAVGSREGHRRLRDGVPDVAVTAGPTDREVGAEALGGWTREWGLVVPDGNPEAVTGIADLVDRDLRFRNRSTVSGLRRSLDTALDDLADERDADRRDLAERIDGYERTAKAFESPVRAVVAGDADAGLGLRETAERLGCAFVPLGEQSVVVRAAPDRAGREPVAALAAALDGDGGRGGIDAILADLPGYSRNSRNDP